MSNGKLARPSCIVKARRLTTLDVGSDVRKLRTTLSGAGRMCNRLGVDRVRDPAGMTRVVGGCVAARASAAFGSLFARRRCRRVGGFTGRGLVFSVTVVPGIGPTFLDGGLMIVLCVGRMNNCGPRRRLSACFRARTARGKRGAGKLRAVRFRVGLLCGRASLGHRTRRLLYVLGGIRPAVSRARELATACVARSLSTVDGVTSRSLKNPRYRVAPRRGTALVSSHGGG